MQVPGWKILSTHDDDDSKEKERHKENFGVMLAPLLKSVTKTFREYKSLKTQFRGGQWWYKPLIPALGRQRKVDLCEL